MKIVQILYPGLGGHSSVAFSLIEADKENKNEHVLLGFGIESPSNAFKASAEQNQTKYYSVRKKRGFDFSSQKEIYKLLKKEKPDAIIMHSTALVFTVYWFTLFHQAKWLSVEHQSNFAKSKKDWLYTFFILLLSPSIVYLSDEYKEQIKKKIKFVFPSKKIRIIPNGINVEKYALAHQKDYGSNEIRIAMISRFNSLRDHETLIRAVGELKEKYPLKLYLAGDGETKPEMEKLVEKLQLEDAVVFLGTINENEIIDLLKKVNIYIHSSLAETQSTSLLQVMASKTPIIATNIPGINNLLVNNKDALLFKCKNSLALVDSIRRIIEDKNLGVLLCTSSYQKVLQNYSCEQMLEEYKSILTKYRI